VQEVGPGEPGYFDAERLVEPERLASQADQANDNTGYRKEYERDPVSPSSGLGSGGKYG
jgi:hypothetical protein